MTRWPELCQLSRKPSAHCLRPIADNAYRLLTDSAEACFRDMTSSPFLAECRSSPAARLIVLRDVLAHQGEVSRFLAAVGSSRQHEAASFSLTGATNLSRAAKQPLVQVGARHRHGGSVERLIGLRRDAELIERCQHGRERSLGIREKRRPAHALEPLSETLERRLTRELALEMFQAAVPIAIALHCQPPARAFDHQIDACPTCHCGRTR